MNVKKCKNSIEFVDTVRGWGEEAVLKCNHTPLHPLPGTVPLLPITHKINIPPTQNDNVVIIKKEDAECDDSPPFTL